MPKSLKLEDKLNLKLSDDPILLEFDNMYKIALSNGQFTSLDDFKQHLTEGALLNVGVLASKALSIPCGDYMVWMTDAGHTMLVPVNEKQTPREVYEHISDQYDIFTNTLLQNWNKLEKTLSEDQKHNINNTEVESNEYGENEGDGEGFSTNIDVSSVDRMPILRAMQDKGHTVTSLARAVGVEPPAISRILRTPKNIQGDPKGRNPSIGLASQICNELRIDPTSAFPDIFGGHSKYEPRNTPGNRGSGMDNSASGSTKKGKATEKWTSGNTASESYEYSSIINDEASVPIINNEVSTGSNQSNNQINQVIKSQEEALEKDRIKREKMLKPKFDKIDASFNEINSDNNTINTTSKNLDNELIAIRSLLNDLGNGITSN